MRFSIGVGGHFCSKFHSKLYSKQRKAAQKTFIQKCVWKMLMKLTLSFNELKKHLRLPSNSEIFQAGRTKRKKEKKGSLIEKAVRCFKGLEYLN
jgi:hypothetical protein